MHTERDEACVSGQQLAAPYRLPTDDSEVTSEVLYRGMCDNMEALLCEEVTDVVRSFELQGWARRWLPGRNRAASFLTLPSLSAPRMGVVPFRTGNRTCALHGRIVNNNVVGSHWTCVRFSARLKSSCLRRDS